ncbi:hypothetical protein JB92DRAFT_1624850 [Gautieria morchelliformis]|nr:hypothetical protein JB92DRAFT_1624850 [Gautieria morchelliformis]
MAYHSNRAVPFAAKNIYDLWHAFPTAVPHLHWELVTPCAHEITLAESNTLIADKTLRINVSKCTLQKLRDALDPFQLVHRFRDKSPFLFAMLMTFAAAPTKSTKQAARKRTSTKPDETDDFLAGSEDSNAEEDLEQEAQAEHASSFESFEGWAGKFPSFNTKCLITIVVIYSMLLYVRNRGINVLALPLALFLRLGGADRRLVTVLNHIGLSASYKTVERLKEVISNDAVQLIQFKDFQWTDHNDCLAHVHCGNAFKD